MTDPPQKNVDYLTRSGGSANWQFYIDSKITQSDEAPERTESVVEQVFAALGTDIVPVTLNLGLVTIPAATSLPAAFDNCEQLPDAPDSIEHSDGVSFETYSERLAGISIESGRILHNSKVAVTAARSSVFLRNGIETIDVEASPYYRYDSARIDGSPEGGPLGVTVLHLWPNYGPEDKLDGDSLYRVTVGTDSNVWFDDTAIAHINRARLHALLHRIDEALPVVKRKFTATDMNGYFDPDAAAVFEYDGPPAEQLIREYRVEWVESELVTTSTRYQENGEPVFEVTSDAEALQTDELRRRIEAYVDHQRTQSNVPQAELLRIVRTDGTVLEARFTEEGVVWTDSGGR